VQAPASPKQPRRCVGNAAGRTGTTSCARHGRGSTNVPWAEVAWRRAQLRRMCLVTFLLEDKLDVPAPDCSDSAGDIKAPRDVFYEADKVSSEVAALMPMFESLPGRVLTAL